MPTTNKFGKYTYRPKKNNFNPDREFVANAVDDFLKNGGKIEKGVLPSYKEFMDTRQGDRGADSFLRYG